MLTAALASEAVQAAVEACAKQGKHVTAAVVDQGGNLRALLRDSGAAPHTVDSAAKKAYTANTYRTATLEFSRRVAANPDLADLRRMNNRVLILGGGVPLKVGEEVIGAIGIGGTPSLEMDEGCAKAGAGTGSRTGCGGGLTRPSTPRLDRGARVGGAESRPSKSGGPERDQVAA